MGARGKLITKGSGVSMGADIYELPNDDSQPFAPYYNKNTGKVHERLPADAWSQANYRKRGLIPGFPPGYKSEVEDTDVEQLSDNTELLQLMKQMQQEIKDLKNQVAANNGEAPQEPVQLSFL
jgi:hypothetical protein